MGSDQYSAEKAIAFQRIQERWVAAFVFGNQKLKPDWPESNSLQTRGVADAEACWLRWHQSQLANGLDETQYPFYRALERARVEQLGSRLFPGISTNLATFAALAPSPSLERDLYVAARLTFSTDREKAVSETKKPDESRRRFWRMRTSLMPRLPGFSPARNLDFDQPIEKLGFRSINQRLADASTVLNDPGKYRNIVGPLVEVFAELSLAARPRTKPDGIKERALEKKLANDGDAKPEVSRNSRAGDHQQIHKNLIERNYPQYRVFSAAYDEEGASETWSRFEADRARLNQLERGFQLKARQLALKLRRRLKAHQLRRWDFDLEEGVLDSRRLTRLITSQSDRRVFRVERKSSDPEVCVTLLVDQSGSMVFGRRLLAAVAIDFAVHVLESCGIKTEVLGFTTVFGSKNPLEQEWRMAGSPQDPGRMNALRHIIYKSANTTWRRRRQSLALLLGDGFGKENLDGESLFWAAHRLQSRPERRKILLVLSDGAPYDKPTADLNSREFLEDHLRSVIKDIDKSGIVLAAIGASSDVSRFYQRNSIVHKKEQVIDCLFAQLDELLVPSGKSVS